MGRACYIAILFTGGDRNSACLALAQPMNNYSRVTELEAWGPGPGVNHTYDATGNVTNDGVHSYTYDSENRLVSVDSGATYAYDQHRQIC